MIFATTLSFGGANITGSFVFAGICALLAASKGRSALTWGLLGFFFQCFALVFVLFTDDVNDSSSEKEMSHKHRRRATERMKKESLKLHTLTSEVRGRLDAHDLAIGLDTRAIRKPLERNRIVESAAQDPRWYYEDNGQTAGPIAKRSLIALATTGMVQPSTLVWRDGLTSWIPMGELSELA